MAELEQQQHHATTYDDHELNNNGNGVDQDDPVKDRGLFDFLGKPKEEEKPQNEVVAIELEKVKVHSDQEPHDPRHHVEEKLSLTEKLHRSHSSSSSSSSDEEEGKGEEKKKKKEKKKIDKNEEGAEAAGEEKKGFTEKIKDKLPGGHNEVMEDVREGEEKEKEKEKGFLEKIKEKLPGHHSDGEHKEKESAVY